MYFYPFGACISCPTPYSYQQLYEGMNISGYVKRLGFGHPFQQLQAAVNESLKPPPWKWVIMLAE
jgi:hypothetical protein